MKRLLISMKTATGAHRQEMDCIEKDCADYFITRGLLITPLPNNSSLVVEHIKNTDCVVLMGGSDLVGIESRRNATESLLLKEAIAREIPVLGIDRGMSFINHYFGGRIREKIPTHSEGCHEVMITDENPPIVIEKSSGVVLSHHYDCVMPEDLASGLKIFALSEDGVVEGLYHPKMKIIGIQWHPEKFDSGWVDNGLIKYISTTDF